MCGRFSLASSPLYLEKRFKAKLPKEKINPRYNIAPGQLTLVLPAGRPRKLALRQWGLIPHWAKEKKGGGLINARGETLLEKPAFRASALKKRCLVPADGFYEWQKSPRGNVPYRIVENSGETFAMAGICDEWDNPQTGEKVETFSIITTKANELMKPIHDRMPVILDKEEENKWIDENTPPAEIQKLCRPAENKKLNAYKISRAINNPRHDGPEIIEPESQTNK